MEALATHLQLESDRVVPAAEETFYTIGEMSRAFGLSLRALRFYEDRGLIQPLRRGQMRLYTDRDRSRVQMIMRGKQLGFTLVEIREMLADVDDNEPEFERALAPDQIRAQIDLLQKQREGIDKAIDALKTTQERLQAITMHGAMAMNAGSAVAQAGA